MAQDPIQPRSYPQNLGDLLDGFASRQGVQKLRRAGPILSILEAVAQVTTRQGYDIARLLASRDPATLRGAELDVYGASQNVPRLLLTKAVGTVTLGDGSFTRVATAVYRGAAAPIAGSTTLRVDDASTFPNTGQLYIGSGTPRKEGPLAYGSKANIGSYWTLTLADPTTLYHNQGEVVLLAQGGTRSAPAGTLVGTSADALTPSVQFALSQDALVADGEVEVPNVPVTAVLAGVSGNVAAAAIKTFPAGKPYPGATVTNPFDYASGRDTEGDADYLERIRATLASRSLGTDLAIRTAAIGVVSTDDGRQVLSASLVRRRGAPAILYVDDGSGYEETSEGVGFEVLTSAAGGGEQDFRTAQHQVTKAGLLSAAGPYALSGGMRLSVEVGGVVTTHTFVAADFPGLQAQPIEVESAINADPGLRWRCRRVAGGTRLVFEARTEDDDALRAVPDADPDLDANGPLRLALTEQTTLALFRNDVELTKDGRPARWVSYPHGTWAPLTGAQTLQLAVDQTPTITYTIQDTDFVVAETGFVAVGRNTPTAWAAVLNRATPGVTWTVEDDLLVATSNLGRTASARVAVTGGSLVAQRVLPVGAAAGADADYALDRATGSITLTEPLAPGDRLTLGSQQTRAFLETPDLAPTDLSYLGTAWVAVDGTAQPVPHGVTANTPLTGTVDGVTPYGARVRITATSAIAAFDAVQAGDWAVLYDRDVDLPAGLRGAWRVAEVAKDGGGLNNRLVIEQRLANAPRTTATATALAPVGGAAARVLVVGGYTSDGGAMSAVNVGTYDGTPPMITATAELWDPVSGAWTYTNSLNTGRAAHTATLLNDGRVVVCGGIARDATGATTYLNTVEIWDPATGMWSVANTMSVARAWATATLLASGKVLVVGGYSGSVVGTSEEFDPSLGTWGTVKNLGTPRFGHRAVLWIPSGSHGEGNNVWIGGGYSAVGVKTAAAERYDAGTQTWGAKTALPSSRADFGAARIDDNRMLVAGDDAAATGANQSKYAVYTISSNSWTTTDTSIPGNFYFRDKNLVKLTSTGHLLALYGYEDDGVNPRRLRHKRFDVGALTWANADDSPAVGTMVERCQVAATALSGGGGGAQILAVGGLSVGNGAPTGAGLPVAQHERYDDGASPGLKWSVPCVALQLVNGTLGSKGLAIVRTDRYLETAKIPTATGYTAPTLAALLGSIPGVTASVYQTDRIRLATDDLAGDILLAATDAAAVLPLPAGVAVASNPSLTAGVAGQVDTAVPAAWEVVRLAYATAAGGNLARWVYPDPVVPNGTALMAGTRRLHTGLNPAYWTYTGPGSDARRAAWGHAAGSVREVLAITAGAVGLPRDYANDLGPYQPAYPGAGFALTTGEDVTITLDADPRDHRFTVPLTRRLQPVGTTYGLTNTYKDAANAGATIAAAFGTAYKFDGFAVLMRPRGKSHPADAAKRVLWRWYRNGDGGPLAVRYTYPDVPNANPATRVEIDQSTVPNDLGGAIRAVVDVTLNSGAARAASVTRTTTRVGTARVHGSGTTDTWDVYFLFGFSVVEGQRTGTSSTGNRLKLAIPNNGVIAQGPQDSGILVGDVLWFQATAPSPTTLTSGTFTVTQVDAFAGGSGTQNIYFAGTSLNDGSAPTYGPTANVGTVSADPAGQVTLDPALQVGDLIRLETGVAAPAYTGQTVRVAAFGSQYVRARAIDLTLAGAQTTPTWTALNATSNLTLFQGPNLTAAQLVTAVAASAHPAVAGTVTGNGTGVIAQATWEELDTATAAYDLTDGINYVQTTTNPATPALDHQLTFRLPPNSALASDTDWANEPVEVVPIVTPDVVRWCNTLAVTGLSTAAEIAAAAAGRAVQITTRTPGAAGSVEVQAGSAIAARAPVVGAAYTLDRTGTAKDTVVVTVAAALAAGFGAGVYRLTNDLPLPRPPFWNSGTTIAATTAGVWTLGTSPYTVRNTFNHLRIQLEPAGGFAVIRIPRELNTAVPTVGTDVHPFDFVYVTTRSSAASDLPDPNNSNRGVFRVQAVTSTPYDVQVWIDHPGVVAEVVEAKIKFLTPDSAVAGDLWTVATDALGTANRGDRAISEVGTTTPGGEQYLNATFRVDIGTLPTANLATVALGSAADAVRIVEGTPTSTVHRFVTLTPNPADATLADLQLDTPPPAGSASAAAGTVVEALGKLGFPTLQVAGTDAYTFATGLVGEVSHVLYGDREDLAARGGVVATGAEVLVAGPTVRRVRVGLAVRAVNDAAGNDLADRIRSAVADVINSAGVGESIPLGAVVAAAQSLPGVEAVTITFPTYAIGSDRIVVQGHEKPLVLDLRSDIQVVFIG